MTIRSRTFLGLAVGAPVLLLVLWTLGGLTEERQIGIPTVPLVTLASLPLDLWLRDLATAVTIGAVLVGAVLAPRVAARLTQIASLAAILWLVTLVAQSVLTVSEVLARPLSESVDTTVIWSLLSQTDLGMVMLAQAGLVAVIASAAWLTSGRGMGVVLLVVAMVAAWLPGLTGHSGLEHGHVSASIGLGLHVVFASLWVGGLIAMAIYAGSGEPEPGVVLGRFSVVALASVIVIAETGLLNAALRLDGIAALLSSQYGTIILAKVSVLVVLIGWGMRQRAAIAGRWRGLPDADLRDPEYRSTFLRWCGWEVLWMGAVYGLSIALSRTAPPGFSIAGDEMTVGGIVLLVLGLPMAIGFVTALGPRAPRAAVAFPEAVAVVALVAVVVAGEWVPSGMATATVGVQVGTLLGALVVLAAGTLFVAVVRARRAVGAVAIMMIGLPVAFWWLERDVSDGWSSGTWASVLLAEGLLVLLMRDTLSVASTTTPVPDETAADRALA